MNIWYFFTNIPGLEAAKDVGMGIAIFFILFVALLKKSWCNLVMINKFIKLYIFYNLHSGLFFFRFSTEDIFLSDATNLFIASSSLVKNKERNEILKLYFFHYTKNKKIISDFANLKWHYACKITSQNTDVIIKSSKVSHKEKSILVFMKPLFRFSPSWILFAVISSRYWPRLRLKLPGTRLPSNQIGCPGETLN